MFQPLRSPVDLMRALNAYAYGAAPAELAERLQTMIGVDADKISTGREILYAHRDLLDEQGLTVLGQLAEYAVYSTWVGDNADGRCEKIVAGVKRDLGDKSVKAKPENDPAPRVQYRDEGFDWQNPPEPAEEAAPPEAGK